MKWKDLRKIFNDHLLDDEEILSIHINCEGTIFFQCTEEGTEIK